MPIKTVGIRSVTTLSLKIIYDLKKQKKKKNEELLETWTNLKEQIISKLNKTNNYSPTDQKLANYLGEISSWIVTSVPDQELDSLEAKFLKVEQELIEICPEDDFLFNCNYLVNRFVFIVLQWIKLKKDYLRVFKTYEELRKKNDEVD